MPRNQFTSEQIITKLRVAEVHLSQGMTVVEACPMAGMFAARSITVPDRITDLKRKKIFHAVMEGGGNEAKLQGEGGIRAGFE